MSVCVVICIYVGMHELSMFPNKDESHKWTATLKHIHLCLHNKPLYVYVYKIYIYIYNECHSKNVYKYIEYIFVCIKKAIIKLLHVYVYKIHVHI